MAIIRRTAIGIDPGARWTGMVLRTDTRVITGATVGPRNRAGQLEADRLEAVFKSNPALFVSRVRQYTVQLAGVVDRLVTIAQDETGEPPLLAIEQYAYNHRKMAGTSWLVPLLVVQGLAVRYPQAKLVEPEPIHQDKSEYPPTLRGKHPEGWLMKDEPTNRRGHEQSAWDVAGVVLEAAGGTR